MKYMMRFFQIHHECGQVLNENYINVDLAILCVKNDNDINHYDLLRYLFHYNYIIFTT